MVTRAAHQGGFFIGGSRRQPDPTHEPHWMLTHTDAIHGTSLQRIQQKLHLVGSPVMGNIHHGRIHL